MSSISTSLSGKSAGGIGARILAIPVRLHVKRTAAATPLGTPHRNAAELRAMRTANDEPPHGPKVIAPHLIPSFLEAFARQGMQALVSLICLRWDALN